MTASEVFSIANFMAMPMWVLMIFLPKWKVTSWLMKFKVIPLLLAIVYAIYIVITLLEGPAMNFGSLEAVMELFKDERALLAGWVHYLAFDLLVGMWMLDQNKKLGIHQIIMAPILLATFMLGPVGFILFMALRAVKKQSNEES
ncbi:MAG: DUF4281 domain-containing protein [Flavobacteriaceae bacterium]|nr:DUF4281 domain-containing protein [Flavobacteriaceae bacterium]